MMLMPDRPGVIFSMIVALVIVWTFGFDLHETAMIMLYGETPIERTESTFVHQAMAVEFPTPIDYKPIQEICARTTFRPGLLFSCEGQHGGVGMLRNQILKCIRYAIHGGAALVVPTMALRNAKDLKDIETKTEMGLEYLFDREAFDTHLLHACPGMRIYERAEDFPNYEQRVGTNEPLTVIASQFEPGYPRQGLRHPGEWRNYLDGWLGNQSISIQPEAPVHIHMGQSFLEYPVIDDGNAFVNEFGKILSFRSDTRLLAAKILWELKKKFGLEIDPTRAINPKAFYGAHLRLEQDALWAWPAAEGWVFGAMDTQFYEQFKNLKRTGLNVVYVASGNDTVVDMFAESANKRNMALSIVTKEDLLQGDDLRQLSKMTFDQRGLIDFLIMFKASAFMGVAHSSFPWTVALRRHELSRYRGFANEGSDLLRDEYSIIMGMAADYPDVDPFVYSIWP